MKKAIFPFLLFTLVSCSKYTATISPSTVTPLAPPSAAASPALFTDSPTPLPIIIVEPTSTIGVGSTIVSEKDGATLVYVPEGDFLMGSDEIRTPLNGEQSPSYYDNHPQHSVFLDAFWIDKFEVTNGQYGMCVSAGNCPLPTNLESVTRSRYYGEAEYDHYPVVYGEWFMAKAYCEWAGRRLPTEAEWEKAARGEDGNMYPWGNETPNDSFLNYNSPSRDTSEVGMYPNGASPYGAMDMAGNVWEWVNDWYHSSYYQFMPDENPLGPAASDYHPNQVKSLRGGSWYFLEGSLRSIFRYGVIPVNDLIRSDLRSRLVPDYSDTSKYGKPPHGLGTVGFRCAARVTP